MKYILIILLLIGCQKDRHSISFRFETLGNGAISVNGKLLHVEEYSFYEKEIDFKGWHKRKYTIKADNHGKNIFKCIGYYVYLNDKQIDYGKFDCLPGDSVEITNKY